jgi:hypothetical protein
MINPDDVPMLDFDMPFGEQIPQHYAVFYRALCKVIKEDTKNNKDFFLHLPLLCQVAAAELTLPDRPGEAVMLGIFNLLVPSIIALWNNRQYLDTVPKEVKSSTGSICLHLATQLVGDCE